MAKSKIIGIPYSKGLKFLELYQRNEKLSRSEAIEAKCCHCRSRYIDGLRDCENENCPLYNYMPYGKNRMTYYKKKKNEKANKAV